MAWELDVCVSKDMTGTQAPATCRPSVGAQLLEGPTVHAVNLLISGPPSFSARGEWDEAADTLWLIDVRGWPCV